MSLTIATIRSVCSAAILISIASACTGDKVEPANSSAAVAAPAAAPPWQSPVHNISPATIGADMSDGGKWTNKPTEAERLCKGTLACDDHTSTARVKVRIWAETNAKNVVFRNVGPADAILIGKIQRVGGQQTTLAYNLSNGRPHAVYLVDSLGTPYYEIWDVNGQNKTRVAAGKVTECNHARTWTYSFAVFANCQNSPTSHLPDAPRDSALTWATSGAVGHNDDPAWFTCSAGCCTADVQ